MATKRAENLITQSLLDRLCDVDDWPTSRQQSMRQYRESVKRDVEYLLNSRCPPIPDLALYPKAAASVVNYGVFGLCEGPERAPGGTGADAAPV